MLTVRDAVSGGRVDVLPPGRRRLRVRVHVDAPGELLGVLDLRLFLVADVLLRAAEVEGVQTFLVRSGTELTPRQAKALDQELIRYGVTPPAAEGEDASPADVHVASRAPAGSGVWLAVGPAATGSAAQVVGDGEVDPLALRLALLSRAHAAPTGLPGEELALAARSLAHHRSAVARWALSPSSPVPEDVRRRLRAAVAADLDTPALIALLEEVAADPRTVDGAKFEAFVLVDRVLGVGLADEVGR